MIMALIRKRKANVPSTMERLLEGNIGDFFGTPASPMDSTIPAVNVKEEEDEFEIQVAAPGMEKEDFNISLDGNLLTVSSEREEKEEEEAKEGGYSRREFSYQSFYRTFSLPENTIDSEKILAKYKDGILRIKLPKLEHAKKRPIRKIDIS